MYTLTHECSAYRETIEALHPNGNMRVAVWCDCGEKVREYVDSLM